MSQIRSSAPYWRSIDAASSGDTTPGSCERQGHEVIPELATGALIRDHEKDNGARVGSREWTVAGTRCVRVGVFDNSCTAAPIDGIVTLALAVAG